MEIKIEKITDERIMREACEMKTYQMDKPKSRMIGYFNTPEEAFVAYKDAKEKHIKHVAQTYYTRNEISKQVYDALMNYKVEITD